MMCPGRRDNELRGRLRKQEPLARHTSWRVGGPADRFYEPADLDDLKTFLQTLPANEPLLWLGLGSNLLVRDGGVRGTVLALSGKLNGLSSAGPGHIRAEAGVPSAKLARYSTQLGLAGAEFLAGIPGTVGGALAMNAGAFGGETWPIVERVEMIDRHGNIHIYGPESFEIGYRHVRGPAERWFVAGHFRLQESSDGAGKGAIRSLLAKRSASQPTQQANAGSVFRNPPNDYAARLIETAGLKGECIGGACVSTLHANFIVNTGEATARDIETLIHRVQERVVAVHGVRLVTEVHIVGDVA